MVARNYLTKCTVQSVWHLWIPLQSRGDHQVVSEQIFKWTSERDPTRHVRVTAVTAERIRSDQNPSLGWNVHFRKIPLQNVRGLTSTIYVGLPADSTYTTQSYNAVHPLSSVVVPPWVVWVGQA